MWKWIEDGARNWDSAKRGTLCGILPILAAMAIAKGLKMGADVLKNKGKISAAKEATKKNEAEMAGQYKSDQTNFSNKEGSRSARANYIGGQLTGARALPPEVIASITAAKKDPSFQHSVIDTSKGMGWNAVGDAAQGASDIAASYAKGLGMDQGGVMGAMAQDAGTPTTLRSGCPSGQYDEAGGCI